MSIGEKVTSILGALTKRRMWINILLGFSAGLPIMFVYSVVKIWLRREGVDLSTIGIMSWIAVPYSLNFLLGPILDRFVPTSLGRRRSWIFLTQIGLTGSLFLLGFGDPALSVTYIAVMGLILCAFSATQDIAIDAYRREILPDDEIAIGASIYVYGYRVAMLVATGFGLWIVDPATFGFSFNQMFYVMAGIMGLNIITTFIAVEPKMDFERPATLKEMVVDPFSEFFGRQGVLAAMAILSFIFLFKFGDAMVGSLLGPFYVDMGYSNKTIAEIAKGIGFISTMAGLGIGALIIFYLGVVRSLFAFGILQAISTALFSILTVEGIKGTSWGLMICVGFEDFSSGMGTTALIAFMSVMTNRQYTATQYALFASLASLGRTLFAGFSGMIVESIGYTSFFYLGSALALPGLGLVYFVWKIQNSDGGSASFGASGTGGISEKPESFVETSTQFEGVQPLLADDGTQPERKEERQPEL